MNIIHQTRPSSLARNVGMRLDILQVTLEYFFTSYNNIHNDIYNSVMDMEYIVVSLPHWEWAVGQII